MRILVIEEWSEATNVFIQGLHTGTACRIEQAESIDDGLLRILHGGGSIDIVICTVDHAPDDALRLPERVRTATSHALIRCPQMVVLASPPLPLPYAAKCMDQRVTYLLRDSTEQVFETVKVMLWRLRAVKSGPTIRIEFRGGHYQFFICAPTSSEEIRVSTRIGQLLLLLAREFKACTVEMLAAELGISRQSVKKYIRELRLVLDSVARRLFVSESLSMVWMERGPGGTLCGLRVHPIWG